MRPFTILFLDKSPTPIFRLSRNTFKNTAQTHIVIGNWPSVLWERRITLHLRCWRERDTLSWWIGGQWGSSFTRCLSVMLLFLVKITNRYISKFKTTKSTSTSLHKYLFLLRWSTSSAGCWANRRPGWAKMEQMKLKPTPGLKTSVGTKSKIWNHPSFLNCSQTSTLNILINTNSLSLGSTRATTKTTKKILIL